MKKLSKILSIFLMVLSIAGLSSCSNLLGNQAESDKAYLSISVSDDSFRTVLPADYDKTALNYELWVKKNSETAKATKVATWESYTDMSQDGSVVLDAGSWIFTLNAFNGNTKCFTAEKETAVVTGNNQLTFDLEAVDGSGTIDYTFYFPEQAEGTVSASLLLYKQSEEDSSVKNLVETKTNCAITVDAGLFDSVVYSGINYTKSVAAGTYVVVVKVSIDGTVVNSYSEYVKVAAGFTSSAEEKITLTNYNKASVSSDDLQSLLDSCESTAVTAVIMDSYPDFSTIRQVLKNTSKQVKLDFSHCTAMTSVDSYSFSDCTSLADIELPYWLTNIRESAFSGCTGLTSVTVPARVTKIGYKAFDGCSSLATVTMKNPDVTEIYLYELTLSGNWSAENPDVSSEDNYSSTATYSTSTNYAYALTNTYAEYYWYLF